MDYAVLEATSAELEKTFVVRRIGARASGEGATKFGWEEDKIELEDTKDT
jgi:hypothetical protein